MTLNSTIITAAYRESNFTGQSAVLTTEEQTEGLQLLQSLVDSFFGLVIGTKANPWFVPHAFNTSPDAANYPALPGDTDHRNQNAYKYPPSNTRVFLRSTTPETVYFQMKPQDGAMMEFVDAGFTEPVTLDGNGMFIGDVGVGYTDVIPASFGGGSRVPRRTYVFRGDIASWVQTNDLSLALHMPFPAEFDDFWITSLAMRLAPRYGNTPNEITMIRNRDMLTYIRGTYRQTAETIGNGTSRTSQTYGSTFGGSDPDSGRI